MTTLSTLSARALSAEQLSTVDGGINNLGGVHTSGRKATIEIKDFSVNKGANLTQLQDFLAGLGG